MRQSGDNRWQTTRISRALDMALQTLLGQEAPLVISYGANRDELWAFDSDRVRGVLGKAEDGLILVWDGTEPSPLFGELINISEYLSPLTWTLCGARRSPSAKLAVVDCDPGKNAKGRFYQVLQTLDPAGLPFRLVASPHRCVSEGIAASLTGEVGPNREACVDLLCHHIRGMLTERAQDGNRHALANIVAPLILMGHRQSEASTPGQHALLSLFREMGLLGADLKAGAAGTPAASPSEPGTKGRDRTPKAGEVHLLLVDDQWDCGWDEWVRHMVADRMGHSVAVADSPGLLVDAIQVAVDPSDPRSDARFRLTFGSSTAETIVLLDLRLFSLLPPSVEAEFVASRVLPLCRHFSGDVGSPGSGEAKVFAWPGFSLAELDAANQWCANPSRETEAYLHVLGLLPRLLALADCSVPLVLFSSTGQRRIIEELKPYGNIITDFEKPRFTGLESVDVVVDAESRFLSALGKASALLAARRHCRQILTLDANTGRPQEEARAAPLASASELSGDEKNRSTKYVELYLDEQDWDQRNDYFSVGGCFAVHVGGGPEKAYAKADRFDDWLVGQGVRYFDSRGVGVTLPKGKGRPKSKGHDLMPLIAHYQDQPDSPAQLGLIRLRVQRKSSETLGSGDLFDPTKADNRYHLVLKALLEVFFCESVPALAGEVAPQDVIVSVFPATRVVRIPPEYQDREMTRFGLKRLAATNLFFSLDRSQVYPLVADILDAHQFDRKTYRLVAVQLPYSGSEHVSLAEFFRCRQCSRVISVDRDKRAAPRDHLDCECKKPDWQPDYRALHYLADEVLSQFPDGQSTYRYDTIFAGPVMPGEFDEIMDPHFASSVNAGRYLDLGDIVKAVSTFEVRPFCLPGAKPRASFWLQKRLRNALPAMSGDEFVRIACNLAERCQGSTQRMEAALEGLKKAWGSRQAKDLRQPSVPPGDG